MHQRWNRRDVLKRGSAGAAWLASLGIPEYLWAMQAGDELIPFTDYTDDFKVEAQAANPRVRCFDLRRLTSWATPNDEFYTFHQTGTVRVDPATFRLRIGGGVERPREFTLDELKARPDRRDEAVTLECSGNSPRPQRMNGLLSNGVWTGVGLASILNECGVKAEAREVVFLGLDMEREKKWQARNQEYTAPHGRSMYVQDALNPEALLAFSLNGQPLPPEQGFPLRLILPGWYGMTQVKWLSRIEVIDRRYEGQHMARNYLSLRAIETPDGPVWLDMSISRTNMKSAVARVTRRPLSAEGQGSNPSAHLSGASHRYGRPISQSQTRGFRAHPAPLAPPIQARSGLSPGRWEYRIAGAAWGGQTPIESVDVQIDTGEWQRATIDERRGKYAWILWSLTLRDLAPGTHTMVSRATDASGRRQPTADERNRVLASGREEFSQWPREILVPE